MWEFELIAERTFNSYFEKLTFKIGEVVKSTHSVTAIMADDDNIYFSIGCNENCVPQIKAGLRVALCDFICRDLKSEFMAKNLHLNLDKIRCETLKILCTYFDREIERSIVLQLLELNASKLNIISFYKFKLIGLQKKWLELCDLINQNSGLITNKQNFLDLTKFLLSSIDNRCESVILELGENYIIYHDSFSKVDKVEPIQVENPAIVLSKLVELNPSLITIKNGKNTKLVNYLKSIFTTRVCV